MNTINRMRKDSPTLNPKPLPNVSKSPTSGNEAVLVAIEGGEEAPQNPTPPQEVSSPRIVGTKRRRPEDIVLEFVAPKSRKKQCLAGKCLALLPPELTLVVLSWCDTRSLSMIEMCCRRFGRGDGLGPISLPQAAARAALQRQTLGGISQQQLGPQLWIAKLRLHEEAERAVSSIKAAAENKKNTAAYGAVNSSKSLLSQAAVGGPFSVMSCVEDHFPLSLSSRVRWSVAVILAAMMDPELQENGTTALLTLAQGDGPGATQERLLNCRAIRMAGAVPYLVHVLNEGTARAKRRAAAALAHMAEVRRICLQTLCMCALSNPCSM